MRVLDLGCGKYKREGAIGLDIVELPGVDIVCDLGTTTWPLASNSFDEIHCTHVLEHLEDTVAAMRELSRILRPGGRVTIKVPHYTHFSAFADPTHKRFFTTMSMRYFAPDPDHRYDYYTDTEFAVESVRVKTLGIWRLLGLELLANWKGKFFDMYLSYIFRGKEITFVLRSTKQPVAVP